MKCKLSVFLAMLFMVCSLFFTLSACTQTPTPPGSSEKMTEQQWKDAFKLENVTIKMYLKGDEDKSLVLSYKLDKDNLLINAYNVDIAQKDLAQQVRAQFDFSKAYSVANFVNEKYQVQNYKPYDNDLCVFNDAYLTFEDGKITSITAKITEWADTIEEYVTNDFIVLFEDYGTTVATLPKGDYTEEQWQQLFTKDKFSNVTYDIKAFGAKGTVCFANGMTKITSGSKEIYCVNDVWYAYDTTTKQHELCDQEDITIYNANYLRTFNEYRDSLGGFYNLFKYNAELDEYSNNLFGAFMKVKIENDRMVSLVIGNESFPDWDSNYSFYNYGTTSIVLPFEIQG